MLGEQCSGAFLVQTGKADHPVFSSPQNILDRLLEERRRFNLPPYTRLIDTDFGGHKERESLAIDSSLQKRKNEIRERARAFEKKTSGRVRVIIDVDPIV
jgi:primosomal protein N'